jgi:hypothetical protein
MYEHRYALVRDAQGGPREEKLLRIRAVYEHALCPMGRKQGPIAHSLTLLPGEQVRIVEFDRYKRTTKVEQRFSVRSSFFSYVSRVSEKSSSVKVEAGASFSRTTSVAGEAGAGLDLGFISFGAEASASTTTSIAAHLDVETAFDSFSRTAEIASSAVETERSIVVSTSEEVESTSSVARTIRNDNPCRAVTYFVRRVLEVYCLTTRLVAIEIQAGENWLDLSAAPEQVQKQVLASIGNIRVGHAASRSSEIALPTDGLLYEAELAHCCSCDPERERALKLEMDRKEIENAMLAQEVERRKALVTAGKLDPFEPCCPEPAEE